MRAPGIPPPPGRLLAAIGLLLSSGLAAGQTGSISGRVADENGGPLPGVAVEASGPAISAARVGVTGGDGAYRLDALPAGSYSVAFRLTGFVGVDRRDVSVTADSSARADATLRLSASADVVVTAKKTFRNLADVTEPGESLLGIASSSSQGAVTAEQIELRPIARAGDVLETVPGVVVTAHSGEGKANQYYLRGFNLDHGTDFSTTVAGIPVNLPTHAHGHGYTDLNFVIPELVSGIQYRKGPYFVEDGDFTTAGAANVSYANSLDETIARVDGGSFDYARALFAGSPRLGEGTLLYGLEAAYDDGPWTKATRIGSTTASSAGRSATRRTGSRSRRWATAARGTRRTRSRRAPSRTATSRASARSTRRTEETRTATASRPSGRRPRPRR